VIEDEETPMGQLPRTGTSGTGGFGLMGFGLSGMLAMVVSGKKKRAQ